MLVFAFAGTGASECKPSWSSGSNSMLGLRYFLHDQKLWTAQTPGLSLYPRLEPVLAVHFQPYLPPANAPPSKVPYLLVSH